MTPISWERQHTNDFRFIISGIGPTVWCPRGIAGVYIHPEPRLLCIAFVPFPARISLNPGFPGIALSA